MTAGREVVEDYGHTGLTLRQHPVSFLRAELQRQRIVTCAEAQQARDSRPAQGRGPGAGAPEARLGQGGDVHHYRGRNRGWRTW